MCMECNAKLIVHAVSVWIMSDALGWTFRVSSNDFHCVCHRAP